MDLASPSRSHELRGAVRMLVGQKTKEIEEQLHVFEKPLGERFGSLEIVTTSITERHQAVTEAMSGAEKQFKDLIDKVKTLAATQEAQVETSSETLKKVIARAEEVTGGIASRTAMVE